MYNNDGFSIRKGKVIYFIDYQYNINSKISVSFNVLKKVYGEFFTKHKHVIKKLNFILIFIKFTSHE